MTGMRRRRRSARSSTSAWVAPRGRCVWRRRCVSGFPYARLHNGASGLWRVPLAPSAVPALDPVIGLVFPDGNISSVTTGDSDVGVGRRRLSDRTADAASQTSRLSACRNPWAGSVFRGTRSRDESVAIDNVHHDRRQSLPASGRTQHWFFRWQSHRRPEKPRRRAGIGCGPGTHLGRDTAGHQRDVRLCHASTPEGRRAR